MEPSSSSGRGFVEPLPRTWSPPDRPTLNTAAVGRKSSTSTPVERSPHPSSVSNSSHSSPWLQQMALSSAGQSQSMAYHSSAPLSAAPRTADLAGHSGSHSSLPPNEWGTVFSAPLDPSTFAALAASGVLGPATPGAASSLPSRGMRSPTELSQPSRVAYAKEMNRSSPTQPVHSAWPSIPSSQAAHSVASQRTFTSHSRSNPNSVSFMKRRSPIAGRCNVHRPSLIFFSFCIVSHLSS